MLVALREIVSGIKLDLCGDYKFKTAGLLRTLALFGVKASLPGAILSVFLIIFLILIGLKPKGKAGKQTR